MGTLPALGPYLATVVLLGLWWFVLRAPLVRRRRERREILKRQEDVWSDYQREIVKRRSMRRAS